MPLVGIPTAGLGAQRFEVLLILLPVSSPATIAYHYYAVGRDTNGGVAFRGRLKFYHFYQMYALSSTGI